MKIVIDTNVLMAGLLKDSVVRFILTSTDFKFYLPDFSISEIKKYEKDLLTKSGYSKEELKSLMNYILKNINVIPRKQFIEHMQRAEQIMANIDLNDSPFIACALAINSDGIWSFDKHFLRQNLIKVLTIADLFNLMKK
jgi:predicted nucleic acid-binding protein